MTRPTAVTVIGWLFVGFGALMALGGVFGLVMSFIMPMPTAELEEAQSDMPTPFRMMFRLFDYFWVMAGTQLLVAVLMMVAGTAFLRLRRWSRGVLESITWLALIYTLAFGAFWIWSVASMQTQVPADAGGPGKAFFAVFMGFGAAMIIAFAVPPVIIIRVLRGPTVRQAVGGVGV